NFGANFLFAATATVDGPVVTLYGCVMGQPTLDAAFHEAEALLAVMKGALTVHQVIKRNDVVGIYETPWGSRSDLVATDDVALVEWPGMILRQRLDAPTLPIDRHVAGRTPAGNVHLVIGNQQADVHLLTPDPLNPHGVIVHMVRIYLV